MPMMKFSTLLMLEPTQDPLVQKLISHYHHCRAKDDTLYSIVYNTRSGLRVTPSILIASLEWMHSTVQHWGLEKKAMYFRTYSYIIKSSFEPLEGQIIFYCP